MCPPYIHGLFRYTSYFSHVFELWEKPTQEQREHVNSTEKQVLPPI